MKRIHTLLIMLAVSAATAFAAGQWKLHPTVDSNHWKVIATPDFTYTLGYAQPYVAGHTQFGKPQSFLFRYDKENDEYAALHSFNGLNGSLVAKAEYNPDRRYLLVVYDDQNIDLIFDDGRVLNIPGLKSVTMPSSKAVNDITFEAANKRAWLATDFGLLCIDDEKGQVAESRNYNAPLASVLCMGESLLIVKDDKIMEAPLSNARYNLSDYTLRGPAGGNARLRPLAGDKFGLYSKQGDFFEFRVVPLTAEGELTGEMVARGYKDYIVPTRDGWLMAEPDNVQLVRNDGTMTWMRRDGADAGQTPGTWDYSEFWFVKEREGLSSRRYNSQNKTWVATRGAMRPSAPAVFISQAMAVHPRRGLLVSNHGTSLAFPSAGVEMPILLSGLDGGFWDMYGPAYTNPVQGSVVWLPNGICLDPDNPDLLYFGSQRFGMVRINLADPEDILHMSYPGDPSAKLPGFVEVVPTFKEGGNYCFSAPAADYWGNLWVSHVNPPDKEYQVWVWPADDRRASADAASFRPWKKFSLPYNSGMYGFTKPLKSYSNRNYVLTTSSTWDAPLIIIDNGGTPTDFSDDKRVAMSSLVDQDGSKVDAHYINTIYEDPATGLVWVGTDTGLFTFQPSAAMTNPSRVTRIKVSRNDGTNLADYLLNGVGISAIDSDAQGRKWFATQGAGLVCTSSDGRTIIGEYTTANSPIPSDMVYGMAYNPHDASIMASTLRGLVQYFPAGAGAASGDMSEVRAYPNPVRPDYYGYVTIDGLAEGALVKIADAQGGLVKELGPAQGGEVKWDVTAHDANRVKTGVYYVLASSGPGDTALGAVTKILVVN